MRYDAELQIPHAILEMGGRVLAQVRDTVEGDVNLAMP